MALVRSKFSTLLRLKWPTLRPFSIAQFSSMKETGDVVDSESNSSSTDKSVESDNADGSTATSPAQSSTSSAKTGLEKAIKMFERVEDMSVSESESVETSKPSDDKPVGFATLLRRSKLVAIGKPKGRIVIGTIIETLNDDLYIDFGGKFHCVCKKPRTSAEKYRRGVKVRIRLHDLEMSSHFLGAERDITLLEADATLIGLYVPRKMANH